METLLTLSVCLISGFLLRTTGAIDKADAGALNKLIIYFFIPVISLLHIPSLDMQSNLILLTVTPFIVFISSIIFFGVLNKISGLSDESCKSLSLTCGISSTSFVGFPIFELLYGAEGLSYGVFLSLGGTILVFNTLGMLYLVKYSSTENISGSILIKRLFSFFPFLVFIVSFLINVMNIEYPSGFVRLLTVLSEPFSVIALLAIGMQIEFGSMRTLKSELIIGQLFKLILAPLIIYIFVWLVLGKTSVLAKVCILGAGIGSMNAMSVLAAEKGIKPELSVLMPAIGIPLSAFSLFVIDYLLR